jgi:O-antigen/teichoic acid export membrane protein
VTERHQPGALPADPNADPAGALDDVVLDEELAADAAAAAPSARRGGARLLTLGIASTGLLTFLFFSIASHALGDSEAGREQYGEISRMWAILFTAMCVFYRPVEQLLSRTIAVARARGEAHPPLREPLLIQAGFAALLVVAAFAAKGPLEDQIGSDSLFYLLVGAGLAYAASYFARGFVAGHEWFALYGGLVLFESVARILFPIAALVGITTGQVAVACGILAAPLASLLVVPWAIRAATRSMAAAPASAAAPPGASSGGLRAGGSFAVAVALIQLGEQTVVNAGVLLTDDALAAGIIFSALLVTRAPLQLFQAVQTTLLPHFAGLVATGSPQEIAQVMRKAVGLIVAFAALVAVGLLLLGGFVMPLLFDGQEPPVGGLAIVAAGMGAHLVAGTLNQAALARGHAWAAASCWIAAGAFLVAWMLAAPIDDALLCAEVGYAVSALLLAVLLSGIYRRPADADAGAATT